MNYEALSVYGSSETHEGYVRAFVRRAIERGAIDPADQHYLEDLLALPPGADDSGLNPSEYDQFLATTAQLVEICLHHAEVKRSGFVNGVVQIALDQRPDSPGWKLVEINDEDRRGRDRSKTFGQVKERPCDPEDPSFFGGSWLVRRNEETRRIIFAIHAEEVEGSSSAHRLDRADPRFSWISSMVRARGPAHWRLQVNPDSPLGRWIAALAGTQRIGQHRDQIPLGVLSEAVKRAIRPLEVTHLLLGPSRRDCPERPWHTGRFLTRVGNSYRFAWEGFGFDSDGDLVVARTDVEVKARIVAELTLTS